MPLFFTSPFEFKNFIASPVQKNLLWMMTGNGVYAACQWGMLVIFSKLGNPEVVGQFSLATAIISPIIMVTNMQLRGIQATDVTKSYLFSDYVSVRLISSVTGIFIICLIVVCTGFEQTILWVTIILAFAKFVESMGDVFYGFFQQNEKMEYVAGSMILKGIVSVTMLGIAFYIFSSLITALVALLISWTFVFTVFDCNIGKKMMISVEGRGCESLMKACLESFLNRRNNLWKIIVLAFPLGIVMSIISLNTNIPRYAIEKFLSTRDLGFFAALAYATVAVNLFIQALGQAMAPRLASAFSSGNIEHFRSLLKKAVLFNLSIGICGIGIILLGGEKILSLIYSHEYAAYTPLFLLLMVSTTLTGIASALGYAMTAAREFRLQVPLFLMVLCLSAVLSLLLIPRMNLYGAALSLIISSIVHIFGAVWIINRSTTQRKQELSIIHNS